MLYISCLNIYLLYGTKRLLYVIHKAERLVLVLVLTNILLGLFSRYTLGKWPPTTPYLFVKSEQRHGYLPFSNFQLIFPQSLLDNKFPHSDQLEVDQIKSIHLETADKFDPLLDTIKF